MRRYQVYEDTTAPSMKNWVVARQDGALDYDELDEPSAYRLWAILMSGLAPSDNWDDLELLDEAARCTMVGRRVMVGYQAVQAEDADLGHWGLYYDRARARFYVSNSGVIVIDTGELYAAVAHFARLAYGEPNGPGRRSGA